MGEFHQNIRVASYILRESSDLSNIVLAELLLTERYSKAVYRSYPAKVIVFSESPILPRPNLVIDLQVNSASQLDTDVQLNNVNREDKMVQFHLEGMIGPQRAKFLTSDLMIANIRSDDCTVSIVLGGAENQVSTEDKVLVEFKEISDPSIKRFRNILED